MKWIVKWIIVLIIIRIVFFHALEWGSYSLIFAIIEIKGKHYWKWKFGGRSNYWRMTKKWRSCEMWKIFERTSSSVNRNLPHQIHHLYRSIILHQSISFISLHNCSFSNNYCSCTVISVCSGCCWSRGKWEGNEIAIQLFTIYIIQL